MENPYSARFRRFSETGELVNDSQGEVELLSNSLVIRSNEAQALQYRFTELEQLTFKGRSIYFTTPDKEKIELYYLSDYNSISDKIKNARSGEIINNLLISDVELKTSFGCHLRLFKNKIEAPFEDVGGLHLYSSFLIFSPKSTDILLFLYSNFKSVSMDKDNQLIILNLYTGERVEISHLSEHFQEFCDSLNRLIHDLVSVTKKRLSKTLSDQSLRVIGQLANLGVGGRTLTKGEVEKIDASLWERLTALIDKKSSFKKTFEYLEKEAKFKDKMRIGISEKKDKLTIWYQIPLETKSGLYVAIENAALPEHQTLIIKVKEHSEQSLEQTTNLINRTLIFLNFDYRAIYMSESDIIEREEHKLRVIYNKFDSLLALRTLFFFNIHFKDYQTWQQDLGIILGI